MALLLHTANYRQEQGDFAWAASAGLHWPVRDAYALLAVLVPVVHLGFILWVVGGALLTCRKRWAAMLHGLSMVYGVFIEIAPVECPLTRLENWARARAGQQPIAGDFIRHQLLRVIYPNVSLRLLAAGAVAVLLANGWIYWRRFRRPTRGAEVA
jgi:hypothetical protein